VKCLSCGRGMVRISFGFPGLLPTPMKCECGFRNDMDPRCGLFNLLWHDPVAGNLWVAEGCLLVVERRDA